MSVPPLCYSIASFTFSYIKNCEVNLSDECACHAFSASADADACALARRHFGGDNSFVKRRAERQRLAATSSRILQPHVVGTSSA